MSRPAAIIVGAGYGGMALANMLGKAGYSVDVYEKNDAIGGRLSVREQDGFVFDIGPSWYLMPEVFEQFYELFGESANTRLDLQRLTPGYTVYFEHDDPITIQGDLTKDMNTFDEIEPGAGDKLVQYVQKSSLMYRMSTKHFLYTNFEDIRDMLRWPIVRHALTALSLMTKNLDQHVSGYFRDVRLKKLLEYHMVFLGSSPFQAPAIYSLMSHLDFQTGVYYPRRGMMSLVDDMHALGGGYEVRYHTGVAVDEIIVEGGSAVGIRLNDGAEARADTIIANADLHHVETRLLAPQWQSFPDSYWDMRQPGPSALLVSLGVRGKLPQLTHHTLFFVDEWKQNFADIYENGTIPEHASLYVCNPTKSDRTLAPKDHENLFILVPLPAGVSISIDEAASLANRSIDFVAQAIGVSDLADRIVTKFVFRPDDFGSEYNAWKYNAFGGQSHILKQSIMLRTPTKSRKVKNLYYVGAGTLPGIGLPMTLMSAQLVYKRIMGIRRGGAVTSIEKVSEG